MFDVIIRAVNGALSNISTRAASVRKAVIVEQYIRAGARFGEALSYLAMGECVGFGRMKKRWADAERQYARLGFRTIAIDDFIEYGAYGTSIDHLVSVARAAGEEPVYHADVFEERYKAGFKPKIKFDQLKENGQVQFGSFDLPSTRDAELHIRPKNDQPEDE